MKIILNLMTIITHRSVLDGTWRVDVTTFSIPSLYSIVSQFQPTRLIKNIKKQRVFMNEQNSTNIYHISATRKAISADTLTRIAVQRPVQTQSLCINSSQIEFIHL